MERREALTPGTCHAMQFQVGDRFTDEEGEREVTNRPPRAGHAAPSLARGLCRPPRHHTWCATSELLDRERFRTQADARLAIFDFIEGWYNPRRRHSALDYLSPMIYERARGTSDRPVPSGSTIDTRGAISIPPSERGQ